MYKRLRASMRGQKMVYAFVQLIKHILNCCDHRYSRGPTHVLVGFIQIYTRSGLRGANLHTQSYIFRGIFAQHCRL